jgi:hypothetical protein
MRLDSSGYLGINTTSPSKRLEVRDTSAQLRLSYDGSNYTDLITNSAGYLQLSPTGGRVGIGRTPISKLDVYETADNATAVWIQSAYANTWNCGLRIYNSASSGNLSAGAFRVETIQATESASNFVLIHAGDSQSTSFEVKAGNGPAYFRNSLGVGVYGPSRRLEVWDTATQLRLSYDGSYYCDFSVGSGGALTISPYGGSLIFTGTIGLTGNRVTQSYHTNITSTNAVTVDSDARWKEDIQDTYGLDIVNAIPAHSFRWREDSGRADGVRHQGFIAQEFRQRLVDLGIRDKDLAVVKYDSDNDEYGMATGELIPILWRAIQQLSAKVAALETA